MWQKNWKQFKKEMLDICSQMAWTHWARLGYPAQGLQTQGSIDPESLIILSLYLSPYEARLFDAIKQWYLQYEEITLVERFKQLWKDANKVSALHPSIKEGFQDLLIRLPHHKRWKLWTDDDKKKPTKEKIQSRSKNFWQHHQWVIENNPSIRMRYLIGPSLRADLLSFLMDVWSKDTPAPGKIATFASTAWIRQYLWTDSTNLYRHLCDLENAGLIKESNIGGFGKVKVYEPTPVFIEMFLKGSLKTGKAIVNWGLFLMLTAEFLNLCQKMMNVSDEILVKSYVLEYAQIFHSEISQVALPIGIGHPKSTDSLDDLYKGILNMTGKTKRYLETPLNLIEYLKQESQTFIKENT